MSELKKGMELTPIKIMLKQPNTDGKVYPVPCLVYIKDEADKVIAHHKYKRCLAMAKYCHESAMWFEECGVTKSAVFMLRWEKRWLELAEKFKEVK